MTKTLFYNFFFLLALLHVGCNGTPQDQDLLFVTLGDQGTGGADQQRVALALKQVVQAHGADFVVLLGDNFYPSGVQSTGDPQWQSTYETLYGELGVPVYAVLGNHDYGGNGAGDNDALGAYQVEYTQISSSWRMPATFYQVEHALAVLVFADTNWILRHGPDDRSQATKMGEWLRHSTRWKFAFGHHPYLSNGIHGNAGAYDGRVDPMLRGDHLLSFFNQTLIPQVDIYFAGHDHNLQSLPIKNGSARQLVVGGGGATITPLVARNPALFEASSFGFVHVRANLEKVELRFFNMLAQQIAIDTLQK